MLLGMSRKKNRNIKEAAMKKGVVGLSLLIVFFWAFPICVHAGEALKSIEAQVNKVLEVLRGEAEEAAKKKELWPIFDGIFDYMELSKRTLGRNWKKFSPEQQKEFADLFKTLLGNVYIERLIAYSDEKVVFEGENEIAKGRAEVKSKVVTASGDVPINYRMITKDGQWRVYDVIIEGVSMIRNYRTQFRDILRKKSPEELLQMLQKKVG
jgi:phospholipid transport system substrate-binding protein